jgi:hypothetical protein
MTKPAITPIQEADLPEVGAFLHANLNRRISPAQWISSVTHAWAETRPHYGMQMRADGRLVGVFLAIYADQWIDGRLERFCNPHSWCVLEEYRGDSIGLVLALVRQKGYHFTMLTPNPKVAEIFRHLGFKDLAKGVATFPNLPSLPGLLGGHVATGDAIRGVLDERQRRTYELHAGIPWLHFLALHEKAGSCLVAWKPDRWKKMRCARIIHVGDPATFERLRGSATAHLLGRGCLVSRVETRFLAAVPRTSIVTERTQGKLFQSRTLTDAQIPDLYSELASLDV